MNQRDTGGSYSPQYILPNGAVLSAGQATGPIAGALTACSIALANVSWLQGYTFENCSATTFVKMATLREFYSSSATIVPVIAFAHGLAANNTAAIRILQFSITGGSDFVVGSQFTLYGVS